MLACAKTLVSRYPNSPLALKCLGNSHYYNNSNEKALSVILHVIQIQPDDLIASHDLGSIYHAMKKLPEAEAAYRKGLTINPLDPLLLADLGSIQIERGQAGEGLSSAQRAEAVLNKKTFDNHYGEIWEEWIWRKLGWVYYNTSHFQDAIVAYEKSTALVPNDAVSWSMLGWSFVRIDRCFEAINPFKMSIEFDPLNSGSAWHGLGQAFLNLRQNADAADALEHATTLDAKNAVAWQELGSAYRALGRNADAVIAFEKATTLDPNISVAVAPATSSDASVSDSNTTKAPTDAERFVAQGEQLLATLRFPSLGTADSPLNTEFVRRYRMYKQSNPSYFKNPKWPTLLAEESAAALNSPK